MINSLKVCLKKELQSILMSKNFLILTLFITFSDGLISFYFKKNFADTSLLISMLLIVQRLSDGMITDIKKGGYIFLINLKTSYFAILISKIILIISVSALPLIISCIVAPAEFTFFEVMKFILFLLCFFSTGFLFTFIFKESAFLTYLFSVILNAAIFYFRQFLPLWPLILFFIFFSILSFYLFSRKSFRSFLS